MNKNNAVYTQERFIHIENGYRKLNQNKEPMEHFGFRDGVSKSIIPWKLTLIDDDLIDDDLIEKYRKIYRFGSYLVFRKIEQNVFQFNENIKKLSKESPIQKEQDGRTTEHKVAKKHLEALTMGRVKGDKPKPTTFIGNIKTDNIDHNLKDLDTQDGVGFQGDPHGINCPHFAHIRKVNPRIPIEDHPFGNNSNEIQINSNEIQIVRRGRLYDDREKEDKTDVNPKKGVGLLFMSYQKSIKHQFEYIHIKWRNNPNFPEPKNGEAPPGIDAIMYRKEKDAERLKNRWNIERGQESYRKPTNFNDPLKNVTEFKGGEYFFAPPIAFFEYLEANPNPP